MSPDMLTQHVHATRPIDDGEEITISCKSIPPYSRVLNPNKIIRCDALLSNLHPEAESL